jgi:hypothetical protein
MYKAWKSKNRELDTSPPEPSIDGKLLTRVMYDVAPYTYGTYEDLKDVLTATRGDLTTVNHAEFFGLLDQDFDGKGVLGLFKDKGVEIRQEGGEVIEKTGLIALAGTLKEIDSNKIERGSKVLCCLTSGARSGDGRAKPDYAVSGDNIEDLVKDCHGMIYGE